MSTTPTPSSPGQRSQVALLLLFFLIVAAAFAWRTVLRKPVPVQRSRVIPAAADRSQPSTPEAAKIIARAVNVYATCRSYQDTGRVTTVFQQQTRFNSVKTIRTAFVRPNRLFFAYTTVEGTPKDVYAAWVVGKPVYCWWSQDPGAKVCDNLYVALERARSHSEGAAQTIPRLLDPSIGKWSLKELTGVHVTGTETVDGRACDKLDGIGLYDEKVTVWIDKHNFLLRKLYQVRHVRGTEDAETTEVFTPQINQSVTDKAFVFTPPKA